MNLNHAVISLRSARWAGIMAVVGFCYALATSGPSAAVNASSAEGRGMPRVLGTNAMRPPATFVTGPDLGATVVGSDFARQILVRFGFKPHMFTFGNFRPFNPGILLTNSGKLFGQGATSGLEFFNIVVVDNPTGTPLPGVSQSFILRVVDQQFGTPLHYEDGFGSISGLVQNVTLPTALAGDVYFYTLQGNGGIPPYKFQFTQQPPGTRFMPQGLALNLETGLVYGKPVSPTPIGQPATFDVLLTDSGGAQVTGHFSLDIQPGTISSSAVATAGKMNLQFGNSFGKDSLSLTLQLDKSDLNNKGILSASDLEGLQIAIDFGGKMLPPDARKNSQTTIVKTFDARGKIVVPTHALVVGDVVGTGVKDVIYNIKLDPVRGVLTFKFQNLKMITAIGANQLQFDGQSDPINRGPVIPIDIRLGLKPGVDPTLADSTDIYEKVDIVKFTYRRSGSSGHGSAGKNDNLAPAGLFLINRVTGTEQIVVVDQFNNIRADRLFLTIKGLMRQPGAKPVIPLNGDQVEVFMGQLNLGTFPANSFASMNDQLIFKNDDQSKGLRQLVIDNRKGTVLITTWGLDPNNKLLGADILVAGDPYTVPITLTIIGADPIRPTFDGQSSVTLFRNHSTIQNR